MLENKLIFIYNADGGPFDRIMDAAHKLFAPTTYACSLCAVTYGALTMKSEWKDYMRSLPYETRFYHRDGFRNEWPMLNINLPAILIQYGSERPKLLVSNETLNEQKSVAQLTAVLGRALSTQERPS